MSGRGGLISLIWIFSLWSLLASISLYLFQIFLIGISAFSYFSFLQVASFFFIFIKDFLFLFLISFLLWFFHMFLFFTYLCHYFYLCLETFMIISFFNTMFLLRVWHMNYLDQFERLLKLKEEEELILLFHGQVFCFLFCVESLRWIDLVVHRRFLNHRLLKKFYM